MSSEPRIANHESRIIKAGVIGYPVEHSLSPLIHGYWLKRRPEINGSYERISAAPDDLERMILRELPERGFSGVNVTIPHKEAVYRIVEKENPEGIKTYAGVTGAVNTVTYEDGTIYGDNTDAYGFWANIVSAAGEAASRPHGRAVVLGAGGAARSVVFALMQHPFQEIIVINRTASRAEELKKHFSALKGLGSRISVMSWQNRHAALAGATLLVNTTALGMKGKEELEIDLSLLPKDAAVNDIVYNPLDTDLLKQARARGNIAVDGLGMLLHQAAPSFRAFFGTDTPPEVTQELRVHVLEALERKSKSLI